jgi:5-methylcytosine-specific restriction protein A
VLPSVSAEAIHEAMARFDRQLRASPEWLRWEDNQAHKYGINLGGQLYPVKQIVSLATGVAVSEFSGGEGSGQANVYVRDLGFEVVPLRSRNPAWTRDELILALSFYLRQHAHLPGKTSNEIAELSVTLNALAAALGVAHADTYRNANGVYMKLMNFRRFDPAYTAEGKVGLARGGKEEETVWEEFASDPSRCHSVADAIRAGIDAARTSPVLRSEDDLDDGIEAEEGGLLTALHRRRERSRKLVDRKKAKVLAGKQHLSCEVCGFDFAATYGDRGVGFIECHHTKPVSDGVGQKTRLADLALVCANCHRMIHARRPWLTLDELRGLLRC